MKSAMLVALLLASFVFPACTPDTPHSVAEQIPEASGLVIPAEQTTKAPGSPDAVAEQTAKAPGSPDAVAEQTAETSIAAAPSFFGDMGKTLNELKQEHPAGEYLTNLDAFPDAGAACFGEPEGPYAYLFFGGQDGDFEMTMNEFGEELQCAGFVTSAEVLFPAMESSMSFSDFFSFIGVTEYEYFTEETAATAEGWIFFTYQDMDVWLDTNEAARDGAAETVRGDAPVSIENREIAGKNQEYAELFMYRE